MKLHEYQAKHIFSNAGITVPESRVATSIEEVMDATAALDYPVVLKAQVHLGGRGKAGGIKFVENDAEAQTAAAALFDMELGGQSVDRVLVESALDVADEYYLGLTIDRSAGKPVLMISSRGGIDIESVAEADPDAIAREPIDPAYGLHPYQIRRAVYGAGLDRSVAKEVLSIIETLYELFRQRDATELEINPLLITSEGDVAAVDAVMKIDDDALYRQSAMAELEESATVDELERQAAEYGLDYVRLAGNVGIIGNGAGLVMATLDLVDYFDGDPANFLDIGGGADATRVERALNLVASDDNVDVILLNIFGGITRGDEVAEGIITALEATEIPANGVIVRLAGTNAAAGRNMLGEYPILVTASLEEAVKTAIERANVRQNL